MLLNILGVYGWLAFFAVQAPVLALLAVGWRKWRKETAVLGRLVSAAVLSILTWQAGAYLVQTFAGTTVLTAYPYPFLSDGGTALVVDCALLGLLLSVFRSRSLARQDERETCYIPRWE